MQDTGIGDFSRCNNGDSSNSTNCSINSSRSSSIDSTSSNSTSRTLLSCPSSANSSRNGSICSTNSNSSRAFISRVTRTLSLDSSIPEMPSRYNTALTVPIAPTHECNIVPGKCGSLYIDKYNTKGIYMDTGKDDKVPLHDELYNPIWITPSTTTHPHPNREACRTGHCKCPLGNCKSDKPERRPDFTVMSNYRSPRPPRRCPYKCGTITVLTCVFSLFVLLLILGFVVYTETVMRKPRVRIYYKM